MKRESLSFRNIDDQSGAGVRNRVGVVSNEQSQESSVPRVPSRNWAWAHISDTYDWMDSHSPSPTSDLLD
jgi:hypothetical protein